MYSSDYVDPPLYVLYPSSATSVSYTKRCSAVLPCFWKSPWATLAKRKKWSVRFLVASIPSSNAQHSTRGRASLWRSWEKNIYIFICICIRLITIAPVCSGLSCGIVCIMKAGVGFELRWKNMATVPYPAATAAVRGGSMHAWRVMSHK